MSAYSPEIMPELADEAETAKGYNSPETRREFEKKIEGGLCVKICACEQRKSARRVRSRQFKAIREERPFRKTHESVFGRGETGTERGTALHRFLSCAICDKGQAGNMAVELDSFVRYGRKYRGATQAFG